VDYDYDYEKNCHLLHLLTLVVEKLQKSEKYNCLAVHPTLAGQLSLTTEQN